MLANAPDGAVAQEVEPEDVEYLPDGQGVSTPLTTYVPAPACTQAVKPAADVLPLAHEVYPVAPRDVAMLLFIVVLAYVSAGVTRQAVCPDELAYFPEGQA